MQESFSFNFPVIAGQGSIIQIRATLCLTDPLTSPSTAIDYTKILLRTDVSHTDSSADYTTEKFLTKQEFVSFFAHTVKPDQYQAFIDCSLSSIQKTAHVKELMDLLKEAHSLIH